MPQFDHAPSRQHAGARTGLGCGVGRLRGEEYGRGGGTEGDDIVSAANRNPVESARQLGAIIYQLAGETIELEVVREQGKDLVRSAVMERPRDPDWLLSLATGVANTITKLGILALPIDERVTPLLPPPRSLSGVVVAGTLTRGEASEESAGGRRDLGVEHFALSFRAG